MPNLSRRSQALFVFGIIFSIVGYRQLVTVADLSRSYYPQDVHTANKGDDSTAIKTGDVLQQNNDQWLRQQGQNNETQSNIGTDDVSDQSNDQELQSNAGARKPKIVHITPLYKVDNCDSRFCPYDKDQSIVVASMIRARGESKNANVSLVTTVFPQDGEAVPSEFIRLKDLTRSTSTEYPHLNTAKMLPFANDILDNLRDWEDLNSFDYVIYTNADIIVRNDFYDIVATQIEEGYDGFTINRQTVRANENDTALDLDQIYKRKGRPHPGSDCFVMKLDLFQRMNMGDVFVAYPPLGNMMLIQVHSYAEKFRMFASHVLKATFHLGDEKGWERGGNSHRSLTFQNMENAYHLEVLPKICDFKVDTNAAYSPQTKNVTYQGNSEPCTRLAYKFWCEDMDPCKVATCKSVTNVSLPGKYGCAQNTKLGKWLRIQKKSKVALNKLEHTF